MASCLLANLPLIEHVFFACLNANGSRHGDLEPDGLTHGELSAGRCRTGNNSRPGLAPRCAAQLCSLPRAESRKNPTHWWGKEWAALAPLFRSVDWPQGQASEDGGTGVTAGHKLVLQPCPPVVFLLTGTDHPSISNLPPTLHSLLEHSFDPFVSLQMATVL